MAWIKYSVVQCNCNKKSHITIRKNFNISAIYGIQFHWYNIYLLGVELTAAEPEETPSERVDDKKNDYKGGCD